MTKCRCFCAMVVLFTWMGCVSTVHAQDETPTAVTVQNESGDLPFSTTVGTSLEHVVVTTGNLVVNIPIAELPGRHGTFNFGLHYDGRYLIAAQHGTQWVWNMERNNYLPTMGLWQTNVPLMTYTTYTKSSCALNIQGTINGANNFIYSDRNGAKHTMQAGRETGSCTNSGSWSYTNRGPDLSGAGMWAGPVAILHSQNIAPGPVGLFLADGSQPGVSSTNGIDPVTSTVQNVLATIEDPDGNFQTETSGGDDTLGRIIVSEQDNTNQIVYTLQASDGSSQLYTVNFTNLSISTTFGISGIQEYVGTRQAISSIVLPNGREYTFSYDNYGSLTEMTLPTGASIAYTWTNFISGSPGISGSGSYRYVTSRTVTVGSQVSKWTFALGGTDSCNFPAEGNVCYVTTVTDPLNNQTVYQVAGGVTAEASVYQGTATGTPLRKYDLTYIDAANGEPAAGDNVWLPTKILTTLDNGLVGEKDYQYDSFTYGNYTCGSNYVLCAQSGPGLQTLPASRGNVTDIKEFDYSTSPPGTLLRHETKTYLHDSNAAYLNANIVDKVLVDTVFNGAGTQVAQTTYEYDNYTGAAVMTATSGVPQHDYTRFPSTNTIRGNVTRVQRWRNTDGAILTTTYAYDDLGNIRTITDPLSHATNWSYTDSWANTSCPPSAVSLAFPTQVTDALGHHAQMTYFPCTGLKQAKKDQNDINAGRAGTTWTRDLLGRILVEARPDGGQVSNSYNDTPPVSITNTTKITSTLSKTTTTTEDGLGRKIESTLTSDPEGATSVDTTYDLLGRKSTVSNPHRSAALATDGITTYFYDALGRVCVVMPPDGTTPSSSCPTTAPPNDTSNLYVANTTTTTDQAGVQRKTQTDGLGRLTSVWENPSGLDYLTTYTYDALGNLLTVTQNGSRPRTFSYNSLSQLTSAQNPESGQISYTYDNAGNQQTKVAPLPNQTGSSTVTTTYTYDLINRPTGKTYNNGDAAISYAYDQPTCLGLSACDNVGHKTSMTDAAGSEAWSFSVSARTEIDQRTTDSVTKTTTYVSNLDRSDATITYPDGRVFTYAPGGAGRALSVTDTSNNYATSALYNPPGSLSSLTNGASLLSTFYYDKRLQPCRISVKSSGTAPVSCTDAANIGNILDFAYNFSLGVADNGNVVGITNNRDTTRSEQFTYDALNRIATAETTSTHATSPANCWGDQFGYDAWGNLLSISPVSSAYTGCTYQPLSVVATASNQISGDTYDAAGNLIVAQPGSTSYVYNAENQLTSTAGVTYKYDGDGKRVEKTSGKLYWYGMQSDPLMETDLSGNLTDEYIFFVGKRIARRDSSGNVVYYMADHLGTSRIVASSAGAILDQSDFYPFGGERVVSVSSGNTYKFTGKERDGESGNDYFGARYYASSMGRWLSPDPKQPNIKHLFNPQKWNKYNYVLNNPLSNVDPDGLEEITVQLRAYIPQAHQGPYRGDNRGPTTSQNVTSRTTITVRVETDPTRNGGNPLVSNSGGQAGTTHNDWTGASATQTVGLPTATVTRDSNGNVVIGIKQDAANPLTPQSATPGIKSDLNVTIPQDASSVTTAGTVSGSPAFELNIGTEGGANINVPLQGASNNPVAFGAGLTQTNPVLNTTPLPPPPPPPTSCATGGSCPH